jgi:predicted dehydrogenase
MKNKSIAPLVVGRGMAGKAVLQSLAIVSQIDSELNLLPARLADRWAPLSSYPLKEALNVLFLANPSGLHAQSILEGVQAGFSAIAADKPVCVRAEEIPLLRNIAAPVTVFHGYRVMWGVKFIRQMIEAGELGEVFSFESRYWQSSSAQMAIKGTPEKRAWKNDLQLNGPWGVLTDLGSHVVDTCLYLMMDKPVEAKFWVSYWNSTARHRDTHLHMNLRFKGARRALASISQTLHGAANDFEFTIVGTQGAATWRFMRPDEVEFGAGNRTTILRREIQNPSSRTLPFHSLGWTEGYIEITRQTLRAVAGLSSEKVPTMSEAVDTMEVLLNATIEKDER